MRPDACAISLLEGIEHDARVSWLAHAPRHAVVWRLLLANAGSACRLLLHGLVAVRLDHRCQCSAIPALRKPLRTNARCIRPTPDCPLLPADRPAAEQSS